MSEFCPRERREAELRDTRRDETADAREECDYRNEDVRDEA